MLRKQSSLFLVLICFELCGAISGVKSSDPQRIIGGNETMLTEIYYQVLILEKVSTNKLEPKCGGAVISDRAVLTAGHCAYGYFVDEDKLLNASQLRVVSDALRWSSITNFGQVRDVQKIVVHPKHKESLDHNMAILILSQKFKIAFTLYPIELRKGDTSKGETCVASGYEMNYTDPNELKLTLKKVNLKIIDLNKCKNEFQNDTSLSNMICTSGLSGLCLSDDGGVLKCNDQAVGIITTNFSCGVDSKPNIYIEIAKHYDWIKENNASSAVGSMIIIFAAIFLLRFL